MRYICVTGNAIPDGDSISASICEAFNKEPPQNFTSEVLKFLSLGVPLNNTNAGYESVDGAILTGPSIENSQEIKSCP
jgi:hypothetical protein